MRCWQSARERIIDLEFTDKVKEVLAKEGYDPAYGARPLKRLIQKKIQDPLALLMLKGEANGYIGNKINRVHG